MIIKELLARNKLHVWNLSDRSGIPTQYHYLYMEI